MSSNQKLDFRWLGPYQIHSANNDKGYYKLKELGPDGVLLRGTFPGNRLKLFHKRKRYFHSSENTDSSSENTEPTDDLSLKPTTATQIIIQPPTLTPEQRAQYTVFDDDESF